MTYTGLVRPNLLKGTSAEWSEWYSSPTNTLGGGEFSMTEVTSGTECICTADIQVRNLTSLTGKPLAANSTQAADTDNYENLRCMLVLMSDNNSWLSQLSLLPGTLATTFNNLYWNEESYSCSFKSLFYISDSNKNKAQTKASLLLYTSKSFSNLTYQIRYRKLKLELGTTPTPWCPHVDD